MVCPHCGRENGTADYCVNCGAKLDKTQVQNAWSQPQQPPQGAYNPQGYPPQPGATYNNINVNTVNSRPDKLGCLLGGLCYLWPLLGLILFIVWRTDRPQSSKSAIIAAVVGFFFNSLTVVFIILFSGGMLTSMLSAFSSVGISSLAAVLL